MKLLKIYYKVTCNHLYEWTKQPTTNTFPHLLFAISLYLPPANTICLGIFLNPAAFSVSRKILVVKQTKTTNNCTSFLLNWIKDNQMLLITKGPVAERICAIFLVLVAVTLKKHPLSKGVQGRGEAEQMMNKVNSLFWRLTEIWSCALQRGLWWIIWTEGFPCNHAILQLMANSHAAFMATTISLSV